MFGAEHAAELSKTAQNIFFGKPYIGIFDCLDWLSIQQDFSQQLHAVNGMIAAAFICTEEKAFYQLDEIRDEYEAMPMMITTSVDDALSWAKLQLPKHSH